MSPLVQNVTNILSLGIVIADVFAIFLFVILTTPLKWSGWGKKVAGFFGDNAMLFAFAIAFLGILASLFYSEVAGFTPCLLCWWQRILLYPQALILLIALIAKDERARKYCLALSGIGAVLATYHTYLQFGGNDLIPCSATGVSCNHVYFVTYGYVTIPTMALTAFVLIFLLLLFKKSEG